MRELSWSSKGALILLTQSKYCLFILDFNFFLVLQVLMLNLLKPESISFHFNCSLANYYLISSQQLAQLESEVDISAQIIEEREQAIKHLEDQVVEVNQIFRDLASLVDLQQRDIGIKLLSFGVSYLLFRSYYRQH